MIGDQDYTGGSDHSGQPFKWPKPAADTPAPIATPEEVEQRDLVLKIDHAANAWYIAPPARMPPPYARQTHVGAIVDWASDGSFAGLEIVWDTAALTSSNAEIERLKERLRSAEATVDTFMRAQEHYREAMDERNTFKNAARAAEAQVAALTEQVRKLREALEDQPEAGDDDFYQLGWRHAMERCRAALSPTEPEAMEKT